MSNEKIKYEVGDTVVFGKGMFLPAGEYRVSEVQHYQEFISVKLTSVDGKSLQENGKHISTALTNRAIAEGR